MQMNMLNMNPKGCVPHCRNVLYLLEQEIQAPLPGFPTDLLRVLLLRTLKSLGYFSLRRTSTWISYNHVVHCCVWKLSMIHQWKKFVNDTFSCKVGAWKFIRKIPSVVIIVILSRLLVTKEIESMNCFFTCSKILLLRRSHHLWINKCPAFAVLWSTVPMVFVSPSLALSLVKKLQRELWKYLALDIQAWGSQS